MNELDFDLARAEHARRVNDTRAPDRRAAKDRRKTWSRRRGLRWW